MICNGDPDALMVAMDPPWIVLIFPDRFVVGYRPVRLPVFQSVIAGVIKIIFTVAFHNAGVVRDMAIPKTGASRREYNVLKNKGALDLI